MDLESNLPQGMLEGAASVAVLRQELKRLNGDYNDLSRASVQSTKVTQAANKELDKTAASSKRADQSINQLTGRIRVLADVAAIVGPALIPLGGAGLAGLMALAAQFGVAAIAGGVLIGSLQGVGDALGAMRDSELEPTAENLAELEKVMDRLSPAAREFAREAFGLLPTLRALRDAGAGALFPGLVDSIRNLELLQSEFERIMVTMGRVTGNMAADVTASLASDRWADFFDFIADEGPQTVRQLTKTVGSLTHGLAELWMAFDPVNDDAGRWMRDIARDFDEWASKLDQTQGFEDFVEYLHTTGPQVEDMLGSLFNALVQIVQAAAPLGGPVLQGMTALLDVLAGIADSPVGPTLMAAVTAMALLSRATSGYQKIADSSFNKVHVANIRGLGTALSATSRQYDSAKMSIFDYAKAEEKRGAAVKAGLGSLGKSAALVGGLALASSGAADSIGLTNTMSLALMGTMAGPWGAAVGAGVGLMMDFGGSQRSATMDVSGLRSTLDQQTGAITENTRQWAANELEKAGALKTAQDIGLSLSTITDAALGNADAMALVQEATAAAYEGAVKYSDTGVQSANVTVGELGIAALDLRSAVGLTNEELTESQAAINRTSEAAEESAGAFSRAESRVEAFTRSVGRLNRILSDRASMRDYQQSLDDFTKSMKENGRNWDINTQKGRDNQAALDDIVGTTIKVAEGLKGAARQKFLTNAIADLRDMAGRFDIPRGQIRGLIEALREANGVKVRPVIDADTVRAMSAIERVRNALAGIKDKSVTVRVTQTGAALTPGYGPDAKPSADGSFVPKTGKPYADRHLYLLADGEGVTTNRRGETDRFHDVISGINAGYTRSMVKGMLADGGRAGKSGKKPPKQGVHFEEAITAVVGPGGIRDMLQAAEMQAQAARDQEEAARIGALAAQDQLDAAQATADAAKQNLDAAEAMQKSFRDSVSGQFSSSLTGGGLSGLVQNVSRDTNAGASMDATLQALVAAGLDPTSALYRELAQSEDLQTANELLASGSEYIASVQQQVSDRNQVNLSRGTTSADQSYGQMVSEQQNAYALAQTSLAQQQAAYNANAAYYAQSSAQTDALIGVVQNLAGQFADALNSTVRGGRR